MEKGQKVKLRNGNDAEIVFISDFGKLLVKCVRCKKINQFN